MEAGGPYASAGTKASAQPGPADGRDAPAGVLLPHLSGPAACLRQVLAAHAVRGCRHIVEIGGAGLPLTHFLHHGPDSVTVIDPKIPSFGAEMLNGRPCRVRHIPAKLQTVALEPEPDLALVLLGLSLRPFGSAAAAPPHLLALAEAAAVLVIDYALDLPRAQGQIGELLATRREPPLIDVAMTIADEDLRAAGFDRRRFLVFGPAVGR